MSFLEVLYFIVPSALLYATPLILTGIGALFSERAGVIGLGVGRVNDCRCIYRYLYQP